MVEMVAGLGMVFLTAFLAMAMLGKLNDVRNKVLIGSRYVAWERTVWTNPADAGFGTDADWYAKYGIGAKQVGKGDDALRNEFIARVVAPRRPLSGRDGSVTLVGALPPSWRDASGAAFVDDTRDIVVSTRAIDNFTSALTQSANRQLGVYRSPNVTQEVALELPSRTAEGARVAIDVGLHGEFMQRLWPDLPRLAFDDTTTLVTNSWAPDGRLGLVSMIGPGSAAPAAKYQAMLSTADANTISRAVPAAGTLLDDEHFKPGRIEADVVPSGVLK